MPQPLTLRVATVNLKRGGYDYDTRHHDHGKLQTMLSTLEQPPHVLFLSECTFYDDPKLFNEPLYDAEEALNTLWGYHTDSEGHAVPAVTYSSRLSKVHGSINTPGLFWDRRYVRPIRWYEETQRRSLANSLLAEINGHRIMLKSVHWNGSEGPTLFDQQACRDGQMAQHAAIIAGDFNATSSHPKESIPEDWQERCYTADAPQKISQKGHRAPDGHWDVYTGAIDAFLDHGWWDVGAEADDFTVTVNPWVDGGSGLRIDRIMVSNRTPVRLIPGSYRVHVPEPETEVSDHRMVSCAFEVEAPGGEG